ncbi:MAG TPA: hypothetical protein VLX92_03845 [Kofleriaceae bacterium]|nr:hypothetical protein [Kofleriaceae bacterium]
MSKSLIALSLVAACSFGDNRLAPHGNDNPDAPGSPDARAHEDAPSSEHDAPVQHDAAPPACTLVPQSGCSGADPACDLTAADDGTVGCRAVTKQGVSNSHCALDTDCKTGYTCVHDDANSADAPWCARFCDVDGDCTGIGSRCVDQLVDHNDHGLGIYTCSNSCDVYEQARCPSGMGCLGFTDAGGNYTDCAYMGTTPDGDACTASDQCELGSSCVTVGGASTCAAYCLFGDDTTCDGTELCNEFATPLTINGVEYGFCQ